MKMKKVITKKGLTAYEIPNLRIVKKRDRRIKTVSSVCKECLGDRECCEYLQHHNNVVVGGSNVNAKIKGLKGYKIRHCFYITDPDDWYISAG